MMPQTIAIPSPSRADTETVSTALETAAVFRSNGDSREAMRWLRRAAESAGAAGDDERALSLSRIVADLHEELDTLVAQEATPYPPPPPPPSARAARPPSSSPRASHPPAPSARSARPPSVRPPSVLPRPSQAPRPSARPSYAGAARLPSSAAPARLAAIPALPPEPEAVPASPGVPSEAEPLSASTAPPEPASVSAPPAASMSAPPAASMSAPPPEPARVSSLSSPPTTGARHAARVQVAISTTKVGMLEVRLLAEGESARLGSSEAFLIMLDPASTLLSR
jgi:hypothetical protein